MILVPPEKEGPQRATACLLLCEGCQGNTWTRDLAHIRHWTLGLFLLFTAIQFILFWHSIMNKVTSSRLPTVTVAAYQVLGVLTNSVNHNCANMGNMQKNNWITRSTTNPGAQPQHWLLFLVLPPWRGGCLWSALRAILSLLALFRDSFHYFNLRSCSAIQK